MTKAFSLKGPFRRESAGDEHLSDPEPTAVFFHHVISPDVTDRWYIVVTG